MKYRIIVSLLYLICTQCESITYSNNKPLKMSFISHGYNHSAIRDAPFGQPFSVNFRDYGYSMTEKGINLVAGTYIPAHP